MDFHCPGCKKPYRFVLESTDDRLRVVVEAQYDGDELLECCVQVTALCRWATAPAGAWTDMTPKGSA
ncbi:MAG: hypothetical protein ABIE42_05760 [Candidatus Eisenbacteria bacterium]